MEAKQIYDFVVATQPALDEPEVYTPDINQCHTLDTWVEEKTKMCMITPVPFSSAIANMGVAILYDLVNNDYGDELMMTRAYYPESKMYRRMKKNGIPFFDKESFHQMRDYDVIGFSSFYALQYLGLIDILELSNIPYETEKRGDDFTYPLIILGGCQSYNAEPVAPILDAIVVGEGENSLPQFLKLYREYRANGGNSRKEFLAKAAREIQGIYVPQFIEFTYHPADHESKPNQIKEFHLTDYAKEQNVPLITTKGYVDFVNQKILTKTFVGNGEGAEMSVGSVFIANSCGSRCAFCQGSAISQPYRERPFDKIKEATVELIKNTGSKDITPYSFNLSDFSYVNSYIKFLMKDLGKKVSMSSQRIDLFTEDFAMTAQKSGAKSLTLAIESASPRGRRVLNKNLTECQILSAFDIAFKLGFSKIKIYNICNVPWETEEDIKYYAILAKKFDELKKKYNAKTQIRWSYTPFQAKNCTVLQWAPYNGISLDENGYPVFKKSLDSAYEAFKEYGQLMRVGTNSDISLIAQSLTYGDRRMFKTIKYCHENKVLTYAGGMGVGKSRINDYTDAMKASTGLGWDYFIREKDADEVFAWDVLDIGVTKEYYRAAYEDAKKAATEDISIEGMLRPNCRDKCTLCGVCQNPKLPKFTRPNHNNDNVDLQEIFQYVKPKKTSVIRVEFNIKPEYRYVHQSKLKMRLRKCFYNAEIPIQDNVSLTTDKIVAKAWTWGKEIAEIQLKDITFNMSEKDMFEALVANSDEAFEFTRLEKYSRDLTSLRDNFDAILYSIQIPSNDFTYGDIKDLIKTNYQDAESCIVKVKEPGTARDSIVSVPKEAKDICKHLWAVKDGSNTIIYGLVNEPEASLYDILPVVLKTTKARILQHKAKIEEFIIKSDEGALDMFADVCEVCGEEIESNIWGEPVSDTLCLCHKYNME